jgi:autotransporter-associated beta strand protein
MRARNRKTALAIAAFGASIGWRQALAANDLWVGNTSANWAGLNWSGGNNPPVTGDSLEFDLAGTSGTTLSDNLMTPGTFTLAGITFDAGAAAFIINPATAGTNGFTLNGGITNNGTNLETINDAVALSGADTFTLDSGGGNLTLGGVVSGTGGSIVTAGSGILTLSGLNTYTGGTTLNSGVALDVNSTKAIGTGTLTIDGGTIDNTSGSAKTLTTNNVEVWNGDFTFAGTSNLNLGTGAVTMSNGTRTVTVNSGTLTVGAITNSSGGLTLNGSGALSTAGTSATIAGVLTDNGNLQITQDFYCDGLTGSGTISAPNANKWFWIASNTANETFSGTITPGTNGYLGLNYTGPGTLNLTNTNTVINLAITVQSGKLVFSGTQNDTSQPNNVGTVAGANAVLVIPSGATMNVNGTWNGGNPYNSTFDIGSNATAAASVQNSATLTTSQQMTVGNPGYGAFTQTSATASTQVGGFLAVGASASGGVVNLSGGTFTMSGSNPGAVTFGYGASNSATIGEFNVSGTGSFIDNFNSGYWSGGLWMGEVNTGVLNVSGNGSVTINSFTAINSNGGGGLILGRANATTGNGIVDLLGGTITTPFVARGTGAGTFNFNGGLLKANETNTAFLTGLTNAYVYSGGAKIDDGGYAITIGQALLAPAASSSVSATGLTVSGGGYIDTPIVEISGGGGTGAEAVATIDSSGNLTGITMTNPGTGYTSAPTFTLVGGGVSNTGAIGGTATLVDASGGGLTKQGSGTLTLTGVSTYTGPTAVNAGTLVLGGAGSINGSSAVSVTGGARFVQTSSAAVTSPVTITSGTLDGTTTLSTVTVADSSSNVITSGNGSTGQLTIGSLTFNGAGALTLKTSAALASTPEILTTTLTDGFVNRTGIVKVNATTTDATWANGIYDLVGYTTLAGTGFSDFSLGTVPGLSGRQAASLINVAGATSYIALDVTGVAGSIVWTGNNNGNWTTTVQLPSKNWTINSSPTDFVAGDNVLFDDTAAGTTNVSITDATVAPTTVIFNNSSTGKTYTISGPGAITGSTGVTLNGTGAVTISTSNSYTGGTTVNAGTLTLSGNNTSTTGGTVLNSGTLNINNANALGSGTLTIAGGTVDTTAGALTLSPNAEAWNGSFTFNGTNSLNLGTGTVTLGGSQTLTANASTLTVGGVIAASSAGYSLTIAGPGTVVLAGNNTYAGGTNVNGGQTVVTGSITNTGDIYVGNVASVNAVMNISGGTVNANNTAGQFTSGLAIGTATGAIGDLRMSSGTISVTEQMSLGEGNGSYGGFTLTGGTVNIGSFFVDGFAKDTAAYTQTNGTLTIGSNLITIAAGATTSTAVFNVSGGTVNSTATVGSPYNTTGGMFVGEFGNGTLNVTGGSVALSGRALTIGVNGGAAGTVNLNGGTITTTAVSGGSGTSTFNFNGGTLRASASSTAFMAGVTNTDVYAGGAIIDDGGNNITISQPLLAPTGNGVTAAGLSVSGSGYIDTPVVTVTGGGGSGATAIANINGSGQLTGITMTNPGVGYTSAPTVALSGGGGTGSVTGSPTLAANTGGGLTKLGAGTLTLSGSSTYTGPTIISNGTLSLPAVPTNVPVASYSFNNVTDSLGNPITLGTGATLSPGDIVVNSGSGGTALNGVVNATDEGGSSGVTTVSGGAFSGNAINFDGGGTSIDVPSQIVNQSSTASWTMSVWVQSPLSGSALVSKNSVSSDAWNKGNSVFYLGTDPISSSGGTLPTAVQNAGGFLQGNPGSTNVEDGSWHMLTFVDNGGTEAVYVDGSAVPLTYTGFSGTDTSTLTRIGFNVDTLTALDGNTNLAGNLDDLQFYNVALTATQIGQLYSTNAAGIAVSPQYLPATTAVNITASGATLNINGQTQSIGSLAGVAGSSVQLGSGTLNIGGVNTSTTFAGVISDAAGGILELNGPGTLALSGANTYTGGTIVNGGKLLIDPTSTPASTSALAPGSVSITGGLLQLAAGVSGGTGPAVTSSVNLTSLSITGSGQFDLNNNHLIVTYGASDPITTIAGYIKSGYNGGAWNGPGIISSVAMTNASGLLYGVGYADGADGVVAGLASGQIEVAYTLLGDANLDGLVNSADFNILAANFNQSITGWDQGDFNYDGLVNSADFNALAANFNQGVSGAASAGDVTALDAFAVANGLSLPTSSVPEPASAGTIVMAGFGILRRRRRSSRQANAKAICAAAVELSRSTI